MSEQNHAANAVSRAKEMLNEKDVPMGTQGPARRLKSMVAVLALLAAFSFIAMQMPWYHFSFSGNVVVPQSYEQVSNVSADVKISGNALTSLQIDAAPMQKQIPTGPGGIFLPHTYLLLGMLVAGAAAFMRNGFLAVAANLAYYFSYGGVKTVREAMENSAYGGAYNHPMPGMSWFTLTLFVSFGVTLMIGMQTFLVNRRERKERRESGEEVPATFWETLGQMKMSGFARSIGAVATEFDDARERAKKIKA